MTDVRSPSMTGEPINDAGEHGFTDGTGTPALRPTRGMAPLAVAPFGARHRVRGRAHALFLAGHVLGVLRRLTRRGPIQV